MPKHTRTRESCEVQTKGRRAKVNSKATLGAAAHHRTPA